MSTVRPPWAWSPRWPSPPACAQAAAAGRCARGGGGPLRAARSDRPAAGAARPCRAPNMTSPSSGRPSGPPSARLASLRLPGAIPWAASGAACGAMIAACFAGCGYVAAGRRLGRSVATLLGAAVVAWAVLDLARLVPAPTTAIGGVALWPLRFHPIELLALRPPSPSRSSGCAWSVASRSKRQSGERSSPGGARRGAQDLRTVPPAPGSTGNVASRSQGGPPPDGSPSGRGGTGAATCASPPPASSAWAP